MAANVLSAVAILVSFVSFVISFHASRTADRRARMPVLVMKRLATDESGLNQILFTNVGTGPALNIIFGLGEVVKGAGSKQLQKGVREPWFSPLHLYPIPPGGQLKVLHPQTSSLLGAMYTDALGNAYTVKASQYGTLTLEKKHLPEVWKMEIVPAMWNELPDERPWHRTSSDGRTLAEAAASPGSALRSRANDQGPRLT